MQEKEAKKTKDFLFAWANNCATHDSNKIIKSICIREDACSYHIRVAFNAIECRNSSITKESHLFIFTIEGNSVNLGNVARQSNF